MAATSDVEWKQYTNPVLGLSLEYPASWGFEESPSVGIVVFAEAETLKTQSTCVDRIRNAAMGCKHDSC